MASFMNLEDAIEVVLSAARAFRSDGIGGVNQEMDLAINVVEDFFVNNVFEGVEDDSNSND